MQVDWSDILQSSLYRSHNEMIKDKEWLSERMMQQIYIDAQLRISKKTIKGIWNISGHFTKHFFLNNGKGK